MMRVLSTVVGVLFLSVVLAGTGFGQQQEQPKKSAPHPANILRGGPGDDLIIGGPRGDLIGGGSGDDVLRGRGGSDVIEGGPGADQIETDDSFEALYNLDDGESD